ncbi:phage tail protein [Pseudomonas fragi]|uniref:tail protein X n=1 Tax=Pseudomonas fragi TaxID=296 RepID=UPI001474CC15|nr:phage tail protein [Pseudomonas fragi]
MSRCSCRRRDRFRGADHRHGGGHLNGSVEAVLVANPGLATEPEPYRGGVLIVLPDLALASDEQAVQLWS